MPEQRSTLPDEEWQFRGDPPPATLSAATLARVHPFFVQPPATGDTAVRSVTLAVPGRHRLRLVVAPLQTAFAAAALADPDRPAAELTLVDLSYEVLAP